ncbi:hypothetical protein D3C85_1563870 [compost metagenome]
MTLMRSKAWKVSDTTDHKPLWSRRSFVVPTGTTALQVLLRDSWNATAERYKGVIFSAGAAVSVLGVAGMLKFSEIR